MWLTRFRYNNNNNGRTPFLYIIIYIYNTEACLPFTRRCSRRLSPQDFCSGLAGSLAAAVVGTECRCKGGRISYTRVY